MALAQYSDKFWFPSGSLAAGVVSRIFLHSTNVLAPLWQDAGGTIAAANPAVTDAAGVLTFWIEEGTYWLHLDTESFEITVPAGGGGPFATVAQVQAVQELSGQPGYSGQRQVGSGIHGMTVRPERQGRRHAAVAGGQAGDHLVPQRGVHHQPVQQHEHRPVAAGVQVLDRPGGQLDLVHADRPEDSAVTAAWPPADSPSRCRRRKDSSASTARSWPPRNGS